MVPVSAVLFARGMVATRAEKRRPVPRGRLAVGAVAVALSLIAALVGTSASAGAKSLAFFWIPFAATGLWALACPEGMKEDWTHNSAYWLGFGAPWGGMITSPADFARFCQLMLQGGELDGVRLLSPATVRAMTKSVAASFLAHVGYNGTLMVLTAWFTDGFKHMETAAVLLY